MGATLGRLALARGELDDAERFFGRSLETEEQMRAPVLESRSRLGLARVAIARAAEGDAERARELLDRVLEVAREHGLTALEAEALATKAGA
jgi:tetratricopeptide (TPR) repeat protein